MVNELCLTKVVLKKTETPKLNPSMKLNLREQRVKCHTENQIHQNKEKGVRRGRGNGRGEK